MEKPNYVSVRGEKGEVLTGFKLVFGNAHIDLTKGGTIGPLSGPVGEDGLVEAFRLVHLEKRDPQQEVSS